MEIEIFWQTPIQLTANGRLVASAEALAARIEGHKAGVYVFSRKHGRQLIPFYIGQSQSLRSRLRGHLERNVALVKVVEGVGDEAAVVGQGTRFFQYAYLSSGVSVKKKLDIIEKTIIRKAIADNCYLLNKQNVKIPNHTIISKGPLANRAVLDRKTSVESRS